MAFLRILYFLLIVSGRDHAYGTLYVDFLIW